MHTDSSTSKNFTESMVDNRDLFIELCAANEITVTNTMFGKPLDETATYRKKRETIDIINEPTTRDTHEQLDCALTTKTWKNTNKNTESDTKANIDSDRYPVPNTMQIKYTGKRRTRRRKEKIQPM